ncbi:unnamed protein product [Hymenolepis diminuta]|uniref:Kinesin motor domain-containing protein n=1 Tax=Hymenolepis diminuta TaxID=6216 RepID=A0A0R3S9P6_HYMDI|nr:unnamed protein product [Hymenolepis diminuta]
MVLTKKMRQQNSTIPPSRAEGKTPIHFVRKWEYTESLEESLITKMGGLLALAFKVPTHGRGCVKLFDIIPDISRRDYLQSVGTTSQDIKISTTTS